MLPKRSDWSSWTPLEKATYVAQVAAALALLPTVLFSWLSFRETRLAREDQARYFQAEKAPLIELQALEKRDHLLVATVKNVGESPASDLTFWYHISTKKRDCNVSFSVDVQDTNVRRVEWGQTAEFIVAAIGDYVARCRVTLEPLSDKPARPYSTEKGPPTLELLLVWRDISRNERAKSMRSFSSPSED